MMGLEIIVLERDDHACVCETVSGTGFFWHRYRCRYNAYRYRHEICGACRRRIDDERPEAAALVLSTELTTGTTER